MTRNIVVEEITQTPVKYQETEIVERKGKGHPDCIADALAENVCRALCKMYFERFGMILHHNTDETQIVGGQSAPKFGGGVVLEPAYILLVGRATTEVNGDRLPFRSAAVGAAVEYLRNNFKHLNVDTDVAIDCRIGKGSVDLRELYSTKKLRSNDTSFGVGYAPMTDTEKITLEVERQINGRLKKRLPEVGEDVKVMSFRQGNQIRVTVAAAMIDSEIPDLDHYKSAKHELVQKLLDHVVKITDANVEINVNTADDYSNNIYYLTVTGLSMENGDDGSVGRGNRVNGLITPCRPMSMEASAGKNPVTHVGKLYNVLAFKIADEIVKLHDGIEEAHVRILSQIGKPIDKPQLASVKLILRKDLKLNTVKSDAESIVNENLATIHRLTETIMHGKTMLF